MTRHRRPRWVWMLRACLALLRRPDLLAVAVRQGASLARRGWWRRPPFLPVPEPGYLAFRLQTMYGDPERPLDPDDLVVYLSWCRAWPSLTRGPR